MAYNYITDLNTNAIYKTTSPEGSKLIQQYVNQVGGMFTFGMAGHDGTPSEPLTPAQVAAAGDYADSVAATYGPPPDPGSDVPFGWRPLLAPPSAPPSAASAHSQPRLYSKGDNVMYYYSNPHTGISEWIPGQVVKIHYTLQDTSGNHIQVESSPATRLKPAP